MRTTAKLSIRRKARKRLMLVEEENHIYLVAVLGTQRIKIAAVHRTLGHVYLGTRCDGLGLDLDQWGSVQVFRHGIPLKQVRRT